MDVPLHALLVGIADYPHESLPPLYGPVNDVLDVRRALVEDLGVPAEQVRTLTDDEATRAGIEEAFAAHLHAAGDAWRAAGGTGPSPAFLFYFSGHGSQAPDATGTEPDGFDETIVPFDGREDAVFDIKDHELASWLRRLPGDNVTVVLDCCHSGSGTGHVGHLPPLAGSDGDSEDSVRWVPDDAVRSAPPDLRPQPATRPPELGPTPGVSLQNAGQHVLLAACRDHEEAFEYRGSDGQVRGALSAFLVPALLAALDGAETTYRELHQMVRFDVNRVRPRQTPLCEGDLDRAVFSSERVQPIDGLVGHAIGTRDGRVWVDVGQVHGVTLGTRLAVVPPGAGLVVVEHLEPTRCAARPEGTDELPPRGTGVRIARLDLGERTWRLLTDGPLRDRVRASIDVGDLAGLAALTADRADADLEVVAADGGGVLLDAEGGELVRDGDPEAFLRAVAHVARVAHLVGLWRPDLGPGLDGGVELAVCRAEADPVSGELLVSEAPVTDDGSVVVTAGDRLVFEVRNTAPVPVHLGVVALTADWEVTLLHPAVRGAEDRFAPDSTLRIGTGNTVFEATVPPGRTSTVDLVRAVVTTQPTAFDALALTPPAATWQPARPLPPPARSDAPTTLHAPSGGQVPSRWATASVQVVVRRTAHPHA